MSRARELSRLGNPNIIATDGTNVGFGTVTPKEKVNVVGVVSATQFFGDGSGLDGIASAGIGTALSDDKTKALNTIYFTNDEVLVTNNSVVNPPDSGHIAYTQAPTLVVDNTKELTVSDGDDLLVDVLGISTGTNVDYAARGNGVFGNIYVDNIESSGGQTSVNFPKGLVSTGVATFHSDVSIGGTLTYEDVKNIDSVGLITARTGIKVLTGGINVTAGDSTVTQLGINDASGTLANTDAKLVVKGNDTDSHDILSCFSNTGTRGSFAIRNGSGITPSFLVGTRGGSETFGLMTNGGERLRIGAAGQIGIGGANYGTTGQVLTSQGNAAAPQWADAGGVWTKLASGSATSGTAFPVTTNGFTSTYFYYKILFMLTTADGSGVAFGVDFTTDNGSTWASGSGSGMYRWSNTGRQSNSNMGSDGTENQGYFQGTNTKEKWYGEIIIVEPYLTTTTKSALASYSASQIDDTHDGALMSNVTLKPSSNFLLPITGVRLVTSGTVATLKWSLLASAL